jgi:hypothetical protein
MRVEVTSAVQRTGMARNRLSAKFLEQLGVALYEEDPDMKERTVYVARILSTLRLADAA